MQDFRKSNDGKNHTDDGALRYAAPERPGCDLMSSGGKSDKYGPPAGPPFFGLVWACCDELIIKLEGMLSCPWLGRVCTYLYNVESSVCAT